jgi:hypothetical protein
LAFYLLLSAGFEKVLPGGIFSNQKYQFGKILECFAMKDFGKFYGHLFYFIAIW